MTSVVEIGNLIDGKYVVDRVLGQGGMGIVVQATHLRLQQPVAIKLLLPHVCQDPAIVERFLREGRAAVQLRSEHVARVLDVGVVENDLPYMVLEYLEGTDLASYSRRRLSVGGLVDLALQACEALAEAHSLGIVHRDIKPANLFITRSPGGALLLKLLDFGISKAPGATSKLTASQVMLGTPPYMSPEQMRASRRVDHRSDIWSLGVVLYELVEGVLPFDSDAFSALVLKVVNDPVPRLTAQLPAGLDQVIYRCLEKDPADRFQSTGELAAALASYAATPAQAAITLQRTRGVAALADPLVPDGDPRRPPSTVSQASGVLGAAVAARGRWPVVVALGSVLAAGALGFLAMRTIAAPGPDRDAPRVELGETTAFDAARQPGAAGTVDERVPDHSRSLDAGQADRRVAETPVDAGVDAAGPIDARVGSSRPVPPRRDRDRHSRPKEPGHDDSESILPRGLDRGD